MANLIADGKPYETHALCYFSENWPEGQANVHWLGVFLHTKGDRILFFPGIDNITKQIFTTYKGKKSSRDEFSIDHLTLEPQKRKWHLTSKVPGSHLSGGTVRDVGEDRFLWFGLSISNASILRELKRTTTVRFHSPSSDAERRIDEVTSLHSKAPQNLIGLPREGIDQFTVGYTHLTFTVGPKDASDYLGPDLLQPHGYAGVTPFTMSEASKIPVHLHRIPITKDLDVQIASMKLPGKIPRPFIYSTNA